MQSAALNKHKSFYLHSVVFQAGNTLFRVPVEYLPKGEGIFEDMFALPNVSNEGNGDDNPIVLPDQVAAEDFESFLKFLIPPHINEVKRTMSLTDWSSVLRLCSMWCLDTVHSKAIAEADEMANRMVADDPIALVLVAKERHVSGWLVVGYQWLCCRIRYLTREEQARIGFETAARLAEIRERSWMWSIHNRISTSGSINIRDRQTFDFFGAICDVFDEELVLDKSYQR